MRSPHPRDGFHRLGKAGRQKMTEEEAGQWLSLTALSLSAFNVNNCRFVVVRDPDLRKQINKFSLNQFQIPHMASLIILCADLAHWEKKAGVNGGNASRDQEKAAVQTSLAAIGTDRAPEAPQVEFVGSITSNKYHYRSCKWAKYIIPRKELVFHSVAEARQEGYLPCPTCRPPRRDEVRTSARDR